MTTKEIRAKIEGLVDESKGKTLKELNAIKHIGIDPETEIVILIIKIGRLGDDAEKKLRRELAKIIKIDFGFTGLKVQFEEDKKPIGQKAKYIIVASGKGGVGKSFAAANIAYALSRKNKKVAIIDADIYGASIPQILGMNQSEPLTTDTGRILPLRAHGMDIISTEFFAEENQPVMWRGSMLKSMINSFFFQVDWDPFLDYVIIDTPAGTGDVMMDLKTIIPTAEVIIVTTPHEAASHVATKAAVGYHDLQHDIIGIIENMSYLRNKETGTIEYPFGQGGGEEIAKIINSEIIATIPIGLPTHHFGLYELDEEAGVAYDDIATLILIR